LYLENNKALEKAVVPGAGATVAQDKNRVARI